MSILTKISVVLLVVLVLVACPVFITQATVPPDFRQKWLEAESKCTLAGMHAKNSQLAMLKKDAQLAEETARANSAEAARDKLVGELSDKIDKLRADLVAQRARTERLSVVLAGQETIIKNVNARSDRLEAEGKDYRTQLNTRIEKNSRLSVMLKESQSREHRLMVIARVDKERIADLERQVEEERAKPATTAGQATPQPGSGQPPLPPPPDGTITAVKSGIASINIGSAHGVRPGMKFAIVRGPHFIGYLRISQVRMQHAAGTVSDNRLAPKAGDKVTSAQAQAVTSGE